VYQSLCVFPCTTLLFPHPIKVFYFLDVILKNVNDPYARQFAPFVTLLFLEAYGQVDQNTRSKMEEMLMTWRNGGANGKELFGVIPQVSIEQGVWGGNSGHADVHFRHCKFNREQDLPLFRRCLCVPQPTPGFYSGSGQISKSQVLSELEFILGQKEHALQTNPFDAVPQNHINVLQQVCAVFFPSAYSLIKPLHQLRKLVEAGGVSQDELCQILSQLHSFSQNTAPPPPPPASVPLAKSEQLDLSSMLLAKNASSSASSVAGSSAAPISNITNLYNALLKAGVVSASGTPTGAGETAKHKESKPKPVDAAKATAREYRKSILSQKISLMSSGIAKYVVRHHCALLTY